MTGYGLTFLDDLRVTHRDLAIPNLPESLEGLRIAHVSDVHVGKFTRSKQLARVVELANLNPARQRPHLTLLTGDLIDLSVTDLPEAIDFVRKFDPMHGLAMVEGNHDLIENPARFCNDVRKAGIPLLLDQSATVNLPGRTPVQLMGVRWDPAVDHRPADGEQSLRGLLSSMLPGGKTGRGRPNYADAFPILLAHHPHAFDAAADAGIPLTLAGHTHGGQVVVGGISPASLIYRYWSGLYKKGDSQCFVSNGVGNWFPLRVNSPAEVVHLTLRRA